MRTALLLVLVCTAASVAGPARAEKFTIDDDTWYTLGILVQPQLTLTEEGSPDGGVASDFFLRRGRLVATGQLDPHIGFIFITDQANYGKNGDYGTQFFIQDAIASYKVGPFLTVSAGFMLLPFMRNDFQSAGALNTIDFRAGVIKFLPTGKAFRDMGVEVRGLLVQDRVYYRAGVFSGIQGKPATMTTPEVNEADAPRLTGNVRYNILGKEEAYAFSGIYFAKEPIVNVGFGVDYQHGALADERYLAMNVDAFADYPINEDMEVVAQGAIIKYDGYPVGTGRDEGFAFYGEAGFRYQVIEPVVAFEYFNGHRPGTKVMTTRLGVNYWISKHAYNLKAELAIPDNEDVDGAAPSPDPLVGTLQAQVVF
jgi:hypothetical protein